MNKKIISIFICLLFICMIPVAMGMNNYADKIEMEANVANRPVVGSMV